jgi:hypothetical protein
MVFYGFVRVVLRCLMGVMTRGVMMLDLRSQ